jgi:hypothetical protein
MLMPDSRLREAERGVQPSFMKSSIFKSLLLVAIVLATHWLLRRLPDRTPLLERVASLALTPVELSSPDPPLRLAGAWLLSAPDRRLDGLSGLAIDGDGFLAVSDFGIALRFSRPGTANPTVQFTDLPSGPGPANRKAWRDSEALARDPAGRGWWVAFETRHQLRLFDQDFRRTLAVVPLDGRRWSDNGGAEGLAAFPGGLAVAAEDGRTLGRFDGRRFHLLPLAPAGRLADIAALPDGRLALLARSLGPAGFKSRLLLHDPSSGRVEVIAELPLGHLDNAEGLAAEPLPAGAIRFWVITDRDSRARGRTLLAAFDWTP